MDFAHAASCAIDYEELQKRNEMPSHFKDNNSWDMV